MGCDKVLNSDIQEDMCGICGGDSSNCSIVDGTYTNKLGAGQYHRVLVLPTQAMNIRIREKTTFHLAHFIGTLLGRPAVGCHATTFSSMLV